MKIIVINRIKLPNKLIRFIKWKLYQIKEKFNKLIYVIIHLNQVSKRKEVYKATITLGIPGTDIILSHKKSSIAELFRESVKDIHRYLNKHKNMVSIKY